ncbi:MAG: hypothetical protein J6S54_10575 [Lentisphaeria bacterium]|nr:hypothetical protein [Lentisphaeria bacterium]
MSIIETANALRPGIANTPLDARCRVNTLAEISNITLPYVGLITYCLETQKYYRITKLKSKQIGALTVPDAAVDAFEPLPITQTELNALIVQQIKYNPTILQFLAELINTSTPSEPTPPDLPYTYPEGVTTDCITITMPEEKYFTSDPQNYDPSSYIWSDDDTLYVEIYLGDVPVHTKYRYMYLDGLKAESSQREYFNSDFAGERIGVMIEGGVKGILTVYFKRGDGTIQKEETVNFTGFHIPQYYTRPAGLGLWQIKGYNTSSSVYDISAEYWDGTAWVDFPEDGLGPEAAGCYYRIKFSSSFNNSTVICWSNNNVLGDPFHYIE